MFMNSGNTYEVISLMIAIIMLVRTLVEFINTIVKLLKKKQ